MSADDAIPSLFPAPPEPERRPPPGTDPGPDRGPDGAEPAPAAPGPTPRGAPPDAAKRGTGRKRASRAVDASGVSPMMQQYFRAKKEAGDALLFFRMGDFYELFYDDAKIASRVLGITLTARSKDKDAVPMAGVPVKAYEGYLHTLIREGHRVALCDQVQDPAETKGLVDRRVTRIVTAGTVYEDDLLDRSASNFLLAAAPVGDRWGLAWIDVSTGAFAVSTCPASRLGDEISRLDPREVLVPEARLDGEPQLRETLARVTPAPIVAAPEWTFHLDNAQQLLAGQLGVKTLAGFGLEDDGAYIGAAGAVLHYVRETQRGELPPLSAPRLHDPTRRADLDRATRSCLEILATQREGRREGSLLSVLDETRTAMGARQLREWLVSPLVDPAAIIVRQSAVAELVERREVAADLGRALEQVPDLERIATRLLAGRGSPRDVGGLRAGLLLVPAIKSALEGCDSAPLARASEQIQPMPELRDLLERGLAEHPSATLADGNLIAPGYDASLDELVDLRQHGTSAIARFQAEEIQRTGITSLKVGFNRVFGYYIEITHAQAAHATIPDHYVRKQTLTTAERYITSELKELETKLLSAEERARSLETELFLELRSRAAARGEAIRDLSRALATVDVLLGFATLARERDWVRPTVDDGDVIDVVDGRHPVLECTLPLGVFVPNDVHLDRETARLVLITGPNMAGKSTYIRQVALLVLLAQVGSFVPAGRARIGVVDRIFTRVGAADDLSAGASTFMVEMTETASILNNATDRSLVILDEVGRGTSTWDGLSIAWAISEYLYKAVGARTLFATHYHELVDLAEEFDAVRNVNVAVKEWGDDIRFLHKIVAGGTDRSYGLHVARLAGVPAPVIERARRILADLESRSPDLKPGPSEPAAGATEPDPTQTSLFPRPVTAVMEELARLDPDLVTPLDALLLLRRFHAHLHGREDADGEGEGEG